MLGLAPYAPTAQQYTTNYSHTTGLNSQVLTVSYWCHLLSNQGFSKPISKGNDAQWTLGTDNGGTEGPTWRLWFSDGGTTISSAATLVGRTRLITGTYDGATMRVYLDGVQATSQARTGTLNSGSDPIGLCGTNNNVQGWYADFRVWDRALSAAEVWALYDPATRWDLYWVPGRTLYFDAGAAPPGGTAKPWLHYRQLARPA